MISALVFLLSMPLTVYTLAGCLQLIDQVGASGRFNALLSLSFRLLLFALLALATPAGSRLWILIGALTALLLNLGFSFAGRYAIRSGRWPTDRIE
jgi:hypothetical protein